MWYFVLFWNSKPWIKITVNASTLPVTPSMCEDLEWTYEYTMIDYGYELLTSATYHGEKYTYLYNETGIIIGMINSEGEQIVKYEYDIYGLPACVYSNENGIWTENNDSTFIGNQNHMLSAGYFFDAFSQCYLIHGRFYDPVAKKYTDGIDDVTCLANTNPFLSNNDEIQPLNDFDLMDQLATSWADSLLNSSSYGAAIQNYTSGWYTSLSDVEVLARAIYCEGGTAYTDEEDAVAWVILNRVNNNAYSNAPIDIVKQAHQFSSITGGASSTENSRIPKTTTERWKHSTYLACLLLTTTDTTKWKNIIGNPINGQLFFYSYTTAQTSTIFTGSGNTLKYDGKDINNVQVLGYGFVSSFSTLFQQYNPIRYSRNIYYSYK